MKDDTTNPGGSRIFPATHWTVVLAAGEKPSPESRAALERLCESYWYTLYAFVRRSGYSPSDAEDLTQEFFARLLEHNWIAQADRHKGRFRSFFADGVEALFGQGMGQSQDAQTWRARALCAVRVRHC